MNQKTTIVLLVLCLLVVGYVLCYQMNWLGLGKSDESASRLGKPLIEDPPANAKVTRIELRQDGRETIVAERRGEQWILTQPVEVRANFGPVDGLITALKDLKIAAVHREGDDERPSKEVAGFDRPRAVLIVEGTRIKPKEEKDKKDAKEGEAKKEGEEEKEPEEEAVHYELTVGSRDPLSDKVYVRLAGDKTIYAVTPDPMDKLNVKLADLRTRDFWEIQSARIDQIVLDTAKGKLTLARDDNTWRVAEPIQSAANQTAANDLANDLANLQVAEWRDDQAGGEGFGLSKPSATVEVRTIEKPAEPATTQPERPAQPAVYKTYKLELGLSFGGKTFARLADGKAVFTLDTSNVDDLKKGLDELREKKLTTVSRYNVVSVEIAAGDMTTRLIKDANSEWRILAPVEAKADESAVNKWLDAVLAVQADSFEDTPGAIALSALETPRMTVTLGTGKDEPPVVLQVGQPSATGAMSYLRNKKWPAVLVVRSSDLKDVLIDTMTLAGKDVWELKADRIKRVARSGQGGARTIERVADDWPTWQLVAPVTMGADKDASQNLIDKLTGLKAVKRTLHKAGDFNLNKPALALTLTVIEYKEAKQDPAATQPAEPEKVETTRTLVLVEKDGQFFGQVDGKGPFYEFETALLMDLSAEWARRSLVEKDKLAADKAVALELTSSLGSVSLNKVGDDWKLTSDPAVRIDESKVKELVEALGDLQVVRYVDFDAKDLAKYGLDKPATRVKVTMPGGKLIELLASEKGEEGSSYVTTAGDPKVGLILPADLVKVQKDWKNFQKGE